MQDSLPVPLTCIPYFLNFDFHSICKLLFISICAVQTFTTKKQQHLTFYYETIKNEMVLNGDFPFNFYFTFPKNTSRIFYQFFIAALLTDFAIPVPLLSVIATATMSIFFSHSFHVWVLLLYFNFACSGMSLAMVCVLYRYAIPYCHSVPICIHLNTKPKEETKRKTKK